MPAPAPPKPAPAAAPAEPATLGEIFGQPDKKNWTPAEVIPRTASLPGVAGALLAMQDGLLVNSQLPPNLRGETMAAFLPQVFGRLNQYTKEIQLGEPSSIEVRVGGVPFAIFKSGNIYFAVLGRAGESLPEAQLQIIATQLGRQSGSE